MADMISNFDGITENNKPSSKVLRPPGGGSSDIFGADMPQTPRSVKNHMASNIFSCEKDSAVKNNGDGPRRGQKNVDSYTRLFGEPERPITPAKNHMRSNIPFGANTEAAHQLLANGNGHYTNGKSGSVSSASSSVSSSTENLKMNGVSRSVFRNMNTMADNYPEDPACQVTPPETPRPPPPPAALNIDQPCIDTGERDMRRRSETSREFTESDARDVAVATRKDSGNNPENPYSFDNMAPPGDRNAAGSFGVGVCVDKGDMRESRNPITGLGLNGDGVGGLKPKKLKNREGNPVTGEGYKPGATDYQQPPNMNGANQVINKNRVPPGGYSSGLW